MLHKKIEAIVISTAVSLLILVSCMSLAFVLVSFVPYSIQRAAFDWLAPDGDASGFSANFHAQLASTVELPGMVGLLACAMALVLWRKVQRYLQEFVSDIDEFLSTISASFSNTFMSGPTLQIASFLAIFGIGFLLRLNFLNASIQGDEASWYIYLASKPLYQGLSDAPYGLPHPLLTLLMHISTQIFGTAEWALRLPAFTAVVLAIPLAYWSATVLFNKSVGLFAAAIYSPTGPINSSIRPSIVALSRYV